MKEIPDCLKLMGTTQQRVKTGAIGKAGRTAVPISWADQRGRDLPSGEISSGKDPGQLTLAGGEQNLGARWS